MTIVEQIEAGEARIKALEAEGTDLKAKLAASEKALAESAAALKAAIEAGTASATAHTAALADLQGKLAAEQSANAGNVAELQKARKALANPAFAAAAATGLKVATPEGGSEAATPPAITAENAQAEYNKISGARARADFRAKFWKELGFKTQEEAH